MCVCVCVCVCVTAVELLEGIEVFCCCCQKHLVEELSSQIVSDAEASMSPGSRVLKVRERTIVLPLLMKLIEVCDDLYKHGVATYIFMPD